MIRFLKFLTLLPVALVFLALDLANREQVTVYFDPFSAGEISSPHITVRLSIALLAAATVGAILGGVMTWLEQGRHRRAARQARAEVRSLRADLTRQSLAQGQKR